MKDKPDLLATSPTLAGITQSITNFYCGSSIRIIGEEVFGTKGKLAGVRVRRKGQRYRFEVVP